MFKKYIGIDLGTTNVLIFVRGKGIVLNEASLVAIDNESKEIVAVGNDAKEMLGRTPENVKIIQPMKDGVIADFELAEIMLNTFINKLKGLNFITRPIILICCPNNITNLERNALKEIAERMGARKVYIEEETKMAALGAGMDLDIPEANMVVDIGGGTTDIAVLSLNGTVISKSIKVAGNYFDNEIIRYIKDKYKILIGELTAENIKIEFANIKNPLKKEKMEVKGRNLSTGLPDKVEINQQEIKEALDESINKIIKTVTSVLEQTPPELSGDIMERGIILTGGGSQIKGLNEVLEEKLKVPVLTTSSPLTCVVEGTGIILSKPKMLRDN